jgi:biotin carboxyl carrier protein
MKYTVRVEDQTFEVEITDLRSRPIVAMVDGEPIEVWPENIQPVLSRPLVPELPISTSVPTAVGVDFSVVRAPIPGTVIIVSVKPGDQVSVGQELCVLEAMKMRNAIRSGRAGKIAGVHISPGATVKYNDLLVEFAE